MNRAEKAKAEAEFTPRYSRFALADTGFTPAEAGFMLTEVKGTLAEAGFALAEMEFTPKEVGFTLADTGFTPTEVKVTLAETRFTLADAAITWVKVVEYEAEMGFGRWKELLIQHTTPPSPFALSALEAPSPKGEGKISVCKFCLPPPKGDRLRAEAFFLPV